ncbi:hypothetical protein HKT18_03135 [Flavobacterium sp. IMCC34852]|uniref:Bacteriophage abortive infection AbiH n=1 Tax=Flavobacterium rivulicola TaxID=2732161 RepID=A0A7Y3R7B0_9FLAO|nr:AbiH family protein [Flavobacterium sp. IMCC34852]NNT71202.1 hypothetical protein [Flavobacterium sp. IMCC34852]
MPKILITGNGFDLYHGLPTKYGHFMTIMETIENISIEKDLNFDELFGEEFKRQFIDDYQILKKHYKTDNLLFTIKDIGNIKSVLSNDWYKLFKKINTLDTWIDFEQETADVLEQISLIFELSEHSQHKSSFSLRDTDVYERFETFNFWTFNSYYIRLNSDFFDHRKNRIKEKKILELMFNSFSEFTSIFNKYLSIIVSKFYENYCGEIYFPKDSIDKIFSFNYTPSMELLYKKEGVIYIHGKISLKEDDQNIILGVDELPEKLKENRMFDFLKNYQKIIKKSNVEIIHISNCNYDIENIFFFFGHSLDASDREYIQSLFDFLEKDPNNRSRIIIFYKDLKDHKRKLANLFSYMEKNKIVRLEMEKRIEFIQINKENLMLYFLITPWEKEFTF